MGHDVTNPYGKPSKPGNADEVWRNMKTTPCPVCGATNKSLKTVGNEVTITCRG